MFKYETNNLVICKDSYEDQYDFEDAIKRAVMLLLENGYVMTVKYDEPSFGIVVIEYDYDDPELAGRMPYWLAQDELESVVWEKMENNNN